MVQVGIMFLQIYRLIVDMMINNTYQKGCFKNSIPLLMEAITILKGYYTTTCYYGLVNDSWMQFETEAAYREYMEE